MPEPKFRGENLKKAFGFTGEDDALVDSVLSGQVNIDEMSEEEVDRFLSAAKQRQGKLVTKGIETSLMQAMLPGGGYIPLNEKDQEAVDAAGLWNIPATLVGFAKNPIMEMQVAEKALGKIPKVVKLFSPMAGFVQRRAAGALKGAAEGAMTGGSPTDIAAWALIGGIRGARGSRLTKKQMREKGIDESQGIPSEPQEYRPTPAEQLAYEQGKFKKVKTIKEMVAKKKTAKVKKSADQAQTILTKIGMMGVPAGGAGLGGAYQTVEPDGSRAIVMPSGVTFKLWSSGEVR